MLPQNWVKMTSTDVATSDLLLSRLQCRPPLFLSEVAYNLQVDKTLNWTLTVFSHRIENTENSLLAEFCLKLESVE